MSAALSWLPVLLAAGCAGAAAAVLVPPGPPGDDHAPRRAVAGQRVRGGSSRPVPDGAGSGRSGPGRPGRVRRTTPEEDAAAHAELAAELAGLVVAGLDGRTAWTLVDAVEPAGPAAATVGAVRTGLAVGGDVAEGLDRAPSVWAARLAVVWRVSTATGAPLSQVLDELARSARAQVAAGRSRRAATAGPLASARLLGALPLSGPVLGALLGANPVAVLTGTGAGRLCLVVGLALWSVGHLWTRRLVGQAVRDTGVPPRAGRGPVAPLLPSRWSGPGAAS